MSLQTSFILPILQSKKICSAITKSETISGGDQSAYSITTDTGRYFLKTSRSSDLNAEYLSLKAISEAVPQFTPTPLLCESFPKGGGMLLTSYVSLSRSTSMAQKKLARKLVQMHSSESPTGKFGFELPTMCGLTKQDNTWEDSWAEFYREHRLKMIFEKIEKEWGPNAGAKELLEEILKEGGVFDKVIGCLEEVRPVLLHGDLWSGNWGVDSDTDEPIIYDPSSYYGHSEADLGIMRMFGGFSQSFYEEYHSIILRSSPHFSERIAIYELYHHLNHWAIFGSSYRSGALSIMEDLIQRMK